MDPERTGIRERRIAVQDEALSDIALPAVREALAEAGADPSEIDLIICATVTPDMLFPTTSALMADTLGMKNAAAFDLLAGCTGFMYGVSQAYGCSPRASRRRRSSSAATCSRRSSTGTTARPSSSSATAPARS